MQNLVVEQEGDQALCFCCFMSLCYCVSIYCVFFAWDNFSVFFLSLFVCRSEPQIEAGRAGADPSC